MEVDHKSKNALAGGNSVNSCNNAVNNRENCALRDRAVVIGKCGARILNHISWIDARGVVTKFQIKKYYSKFDVAVLVELLSHRSLALRPMKEKLERVIAALEVEAAMIESHAQRLLEVPSLAGNEQRHEMLELAQEETERAEAIRRNSPVTRSSLKRDVSKVPPLPPDTSEQWSHTPPVPAPAP